MSDEDFLLAVRGAYSYIDAQSDLDKYKEQIKADLIREVEKKVRAEVIEELFNIHCKDVSQNECDGYGGRCYQCKYERLVQKSLEMQELKIEEQK